MNTETVRQVSYHAVRVTLFSVGLVLGVGSTMALELSGMPLPTGASVKWVAPNIVHNGAPMQIQSFAAEGSTADVLGFYRERWASRAQDDVPGFVENNIAGWQVISIIDQGSVLALQLRDNGTGQATGYVSVTEPGVSVEESKEVKQFPKPSGSTLISRTQSRDDLRSATTVVYMNSRNLDANSRFYLEKMPANGWRMSHKNRMNKTEVMLFEKNGQSCEVAISQDKRGKSVIIGNISERDS